MKAQSMAATGQAGQAEQAGRANGDTRLTRQQLITVALLGVFFWFVFALVVRFGSGFGIFGGWLGALNFALCFPAAWLLTMIIQRVAGLSDAQRFAGMGLSTAAAALCDGLALTWFPSLYGSDPQAILLGAAYILWGVGAILVVAYLLTPRQR